MFENQLIDETVLLLTYSDQSQGGLGQRGNPMLRVYYDVDDNWYGPLCQVFSRVYRYDFWHRANRVGVAEANREIIKVAEMYRPKYVLWPATTFTVTEDTLMALREIGCVVVGRFFDDDHRFDNYSKWLISSLDYCITNVPERVPQYESLGGRGILMAVEGHNEGIWQRLAHISKQFDVSFVGAVYPERRDYLCALREQGISVQVFDNKGGRNKLTLSDVVRVVNQSKINLNFTIDGAGLGIKQLKGRMFEITMAGGFLLTEYAPELKQYFKIGREVVCFDSAAEAAERIRYYLQHPDEREAIASRGYERAQRDYTSRAVFRKVFLQIEEDLKKRGRAMPGELLTGMNPMRQTAAEYYYQWAHLLLRTPAPLRDTWREAIELALVSNPAHAKARRMLKMIGRSRARRWIYAHTLWSGIEIMRQLSLEQLRRRVITTHLWLVRSLHREAPVRLTYWVGLHSLVGTIFRKPNPLFPSPSSFQTFGKSLAIPDLQQLLWDDVLGAWALDAATISVIWRELHRDQPGIILECGSGISTLCLAKYALLQSARGVHCTVLSLEQDEQVKRTVEQWLAESDLDKWVEIVYAPIKVEQMCDMEIWNYNVDEAYLNDKLGTRKADWVLVDGPSGPAGCRLGTVPMLAKFTHHGARWFLDDAFRDGELEIARKWQRLPGIEVNGIYPIGKGLATGYFVGSYAADWDKRYERNK